MIPAHIRWKDSTTDIAIPTNSRPFNNKDPELQHLPRTMFKANPIKNWRKSLYPYYRTKSSKHISISQLNAPTSAVTIKSNSVDCLTENIQLLKENITLMNECNGLRVSDDDGSRRCIGGTNHIRRSASTNIKKNYYRSNSSYLKAKCRTYIANSTLGVENSNGSFKSAKCVNDDNCSNNVIFKPSNRRFSQQGAVSSSAYLLNKKNNAITRNNASLKTAYGNNVVSLTSYHDTAGGTGYAIRYIKGGV